MVDREIILTPEGFQRLKEEIEYLSSVKRDEVAERIRASRDFGDISENSEYDDAKNEQAMLEARIYALEERLRSAIVIESDAISTDTVGVGTKVTLQDMKAGDVVQYSIVGSAEADPSAHKLSNESPVGRAIIGHKPGDKVTGERPPGHQEVQGPGHREGLTALWRSVATTATSSPSVAPSSRPGGDRRRVSHPVPASRRDRAAARRYADAGGGPGFARRAPHRRPRHGPPRARQVTFVVAQGPERRAAALLPARRAWARESYAALERPRSRRLRRRRGRRDAHPSRRAQPAVTSWRC